MALTSTLTIITFDKIMIRMTLTNTLKLTDDSDDIDKHMGSNDIDEK